MPEISLLSEAFKVDCAVQSFSERARRHSLSRAYWTMGSFVTEWALKPRELEF